MSADGLRFHEHIDFSRSNALHCISRETLKMLNERLESATSKNHWLYKEFIENIEFIDIVCNAINNLRLYDEDDNAEEIIRSERMLDEAVNNASDIQLKIQRTKSKQYLTLRKVKG